SRRARIVVTRRQVEPHGGSVPELAVELDMAARLLHEAVDHAQAEPAAGAGPLRGVEWLEGALPHLLCHPGAGIRDRQRYVSAGRDLAIGGCEILVDDCPCGLDDEPTSIRHGVARIERQI